MPGIVDRSVPAEVVRVVSDQSALLPDLDPLSIGPDLDLPPDSRCRNRVFVIVEAHKAGLRHRRRQRMEPVEAPGIGNKVWALFLEDLPDGFVRQLRMLAGSGRGDALVQQPGIQFLVAFDPDAGRKNRWRTVPTWLSTWPFSQPAAGVQATGSTR